MPDWLFAILFWGGYIAFAAFYGYANVPSSERYKYKRNRD